MEGYAKLSSCMSIDFEFAIFRKFGALNLQNLLYHQAEFMNLEEDLKLQASRDHVSTEDPEKREFAYSWYQLSHPDKGSDMQLQKFMKIRQVLKEYSTRAAYFVDNEN